MLMEDGGSAAADPQSEQLAFSIGAIGEEDLNRAAELLQAFDVNPQAQAPASRTADDMAVQGTFRCSTLCIASDSEVLTFATSHW